MINYNKNLLDVLPIAKAKRFWDINEPCYQNTVLQVLSAMDNALPILLFFNERRKFFLLLLIGYSDNISVIQLPA